MMILLFFSPHGIVKLNSEELLCLKDVKIERTKVRVMY